MSLDDSLLELLEKLHLAGFFEEHGIPPIVFPLLLLVLVIALVFMLQPPPEPPPESECGDGTCDPDENETSCPEDCAPPPEVSRDVVVKIIGQVAGSVEMRLESAEGDLIDSSMGQKSEFLVRGVTSESAMAVIRNPENEKIVASDLVTLEGEKTVIELGPPPDFFKVEEAPPAQGQLKVFLRDADTGEPVTATVTVAITKDGAYVPVSRRQVVGTGLFSLSSEPWYGILAEATGYVTYDGRSNPVKLEPGGEREVRIDMSAPWRETRASLIVCVQNQTGEAVNGSLILLDTGGYELNRTGVGHEGCSTFDLSAGWFVRVSTADLPIVCLDAVSPVINITKGVNTAQLTVECGIPGRARAKVLGVNGTVLTQDATVTAWRSDDTQIFGYGTGNSLAVGEGGYTDFIQASPRDRFYFVVTGLEGYETYRSKEYSVRPKENKSVVLEPTPIPPPEPEFSFQMSHPDPVTVDGTLPVSVRRVLYGDADVTREANVTVELAGELCEVEQGDGWTAECATPPDPGEYDMEVSAVYGGKRGSTVKQVEVLLEGPSSYLRVSMRTLIDKSPPMELIFDIYFNNTPLDSLTEAEMDVDYTDGGVDIADDLALVAEGEGVFSVVVDTPFPGEHRADVHLKKVTETAIYERGLVAYFDAEPRGAQLSSDAVVEPQILEPGEDFEAYLRVTHDNAEVPDLENVHVELQDDRAELGWDPRLHVYKKSFTAPLREGVYPMAFGIEHQELEDAEMYVVDLGKPKSLECELRECEDLLDVRACVYGHKEEGLYSESDVISCIKAGWRTGGCASGDLTGDSMVDDDDVEYMAEILNELQSSGVTPRGTDEECVDVNGDGYVTKHDLDCLRGLLDGAHSSTDACSDCEPGPAEICHDGLDNNCDGQTDRETYDNEAEAEYESDHCDCGEGTPCDMKYDSDGIPSTEDYSYCRAVSWRDDGAWDWVNGSLKEWLEKDGNCARNLNCQWWRCEDEFHVCSKGKSDPKWYEAGEPKDSRAGQACDSVTSPVTVASGDYNSCCKSSNCDYWHVNCDCSGGCGSYGVICDACGGRSYDMYTGPYGTDLPCEGTAYYTVKSSALCADGWDNNCDGQDAPCLSFYNTYCYYGQACV